MKTGREATNISFVDAPTARLAVFVTGGTQDPIVLLHGGPGVPDYLAELAEILADKHQVIRYDQRGTGRSISHNGRFGPAEHVDDLEAIRKEFGHEHLSLFGHSWGGTLAQLYALRHPERVAKVFLSDSGIGLGDDWKTMERAVMAHNRRRAGLGGFAVMGVLQLILVLPGGLGDYGARKLMARVWRNYFDPPSSAPPPDGSWLSGVRSRPMLETRREAIEAKASLLKQIETKLAPGTQILVLYGSEDIYGSTAETLFARYPSAKHVVLQDTGHLPWIQNPRAFRMELCEFFGC